MRPLTPHAHGAAHVLREAPGAAGTLACADLAKIYNAEIENIKITTVRLSRYENAPF